MREIGYRNQHVKDDDEDPWRWLLHKGDDEEHVEGASFCHNIFSYDFWNVDEYFDQ